MKTLIILFIMVSCSTETNFTKKFQPNRLHITKFDYLKKFYLLRDELKIESNICKSYSEKYFSNIIHEVKFENSFTYKFKDEIDIVETLNLYNPKKFDWYLSTKIKNLYLDFPFSEEIAQEHFEISNNIRDCSVEFENLNFLQANLNILNSDKYHASLKNLSKKVIQRYLEYVKNEEVSLMHILVTNSILQSLENANQISFFNKSEYLKKTKELETAYTKTGRNILNHFRNKNFKEIYQLDKDLRKHKINFKNYLFTNFQFL